MYQDIRKYNTNFVKDTIIIYSSIKILSAQPRIILKGEILEINVVDVTVLLGQLKNNSALGEE